jgi:two-component system sensor histidine kinase YesM
LVIIFVVGLIGIVTYYVSIQLQIKDAVLYDSNRVHQIGNNMEQVIQTFNGLINRITLNNNMQGNRVATNQDFQTLLKRTYGNGAEKFSIDDELRRIIEKETIFQNGLDFLYLYDRKEQRVRMDFHGDSPGKAKYLTLKPGRYDVTGKIVWTVEQDVIVANRAILDASTFDVIGYMSLGVSKSYLQQMIQTTPGRQLLILSGDNDVILNVGQTESKQLAEIISSLGLQLNNESAIYHLQPFDKMLVSGYTSTYLDWHIFSMVSLSEIAKGPSLIGRWIIGIGLGGILIGMLLSWAISTRLVRSMNTLTEVMDQVDRDNFDIRVDISRRDELGRVGRSFNKMMDKIKDLISTVYQSQINQKEAEFKALQAQINPHFLYNTLETVRWLAEFGETEEIGKVTIALSKLMKASISNRKSFYTLEEEIEYIQDYLFIQRLRFQDKINVSIHLDPGILDSEVPRLILQPIVENAIIHGLEQKLGKGHLFIKGSLYKEQGIKIQVMDDGIGMERDRVAELLANKQRFKPSGKGTGNGVFNVHERIRLLYGEPYGVSVDSTPQIGTQVVVFLPRILTMPADEGDGSHV